MAEGLRVERFLLRKARLVATPRCRPAWVPRREPVQPHLRAPLRHGLPPRARPRDRRRLGARGSASGGTISGRGVDARSRRRERHRRGNWSSLCDQCRGRSFRRCYGSSAAPVIGFSRRHWWSAYAPALYRRTQVASARVPSPGLSGPGRGPATGPGRGCVCGSTPT